MMRVFIAQRCTAQVYRMMLRELVAMFRNKYLIIGSDTNPSR
jgi:hypothetical protein